MSYNSFPVSPGCQGPTILGLSQRMNLMGVVQTLGFRICIQNVQAGAKGFHLLEAWWNAFHMTCMIYTLPPRLALWTSFILHGQYVEALINLSVCFCYVERNTGKHRNCRWCPWWNQAQDLHNCKTRVLTTFSQCNLHNIFLNLDFSRNMCMQ